LVLGITKSILADWGVGGFLITLGLQQVDPVVKYIIVTAGVFLICLPFVVQAAKELKE